MFRSKQSAALVKAFTVMVLMGFLAKSGMERGRPALKVNGRSSVAPGLAPQGEFGGDLALLRQRHEPPQRPGESNHYFDLWNDTSSLSVLARVNGLTNNHALFIDSHGTAEPVLRGRRYGLYPAKSLVSSGGKIPHYSPRDFATVLGRETSAGIHNIVTAGCNVEGLLRSAEFRQHFPNATNVTYMTPGEKAFKPMFYQAIVLPSSEIRVLYGKPSRANCGRDECEIQRVPSPDAHPLGAYIADLYVPGGRKPFRTIRAGRELLDPPLLNH